MSSVGMIGTPLSSKPTRALLLGSGELGKEVAIELQRLGIETIAADRYDNAPAMQVAHRSHTLNMLDEAALLELVELEKPDYVIPEIEAIATNALVQVEESGIRVVPSAKAAHTTMNREAIRRLVAEELGLPTSKFQFVDSESDYLNAVEEIGIPCVVKPIMSSSGKGQSTVRDEPSALSSWRYAREGARGSADKVIVEEYVEFDYEITLLTVRHRFGTSFCAPIGHRQERGDYRESWQPHPMDPATLTRCEDIARQVTDELGGWGLFGVEFFVRDDNVFFSELSPRPHDTGLVTLVSQDLSEFALHVRAVLGQPIPEIRQLGPSASCVILVEGRSSSVQFGNTDEALRQPGSHLRFFGKPEVDGERRMGVALATGASIEEARKIARRTSELVSVGSEDDGDQPAVTRI